MNTTREHLFEHEKTPLSNKLSLIRIVLDATMQLHVTVTGRPRADLLKITLTQVSWKAFQVCLSIS
jgi:hypothetical protein